MMIAVSSLALSYTPGLLPRAAMRRTVRMAEGEDILLAKFGLPEADAIVTGRRSALGLGLAAAATVPMLGLQQAAFAEDGMFSLPPLPYAYVRRNPPRQPDKRLLFACVLSLSSLRCVLRRMPSSHTSTPRQ